MSSFKPPSFVCVFPHEAPPHQYGVDTFLYEAGIAATTFAGCFAYGDGTMASVAVSLAGDPDDPDPLGAYAPEANGDAWQDFANLDQFADGYGPPNNPL